MTLIVKDRVTETTTSTGTGTVTLAGALTGFRTFASVCAVGDTCYYLIEAIDANGVPIGDWETGYGTYSATNTLTRTTVKDSSNSAAAVNFAAGTKRVSISVIASQVRPTRVPTDFSLTTAGIAVTLTTTLDPTRGLTVWRTDVGSGSADRYGFYGKALPAGSYTAIMKVGFPPWGNNYYFRAGLAVVESSTGKCVTACYNSQGGSPRWSSFRMSDASTYGAGIIDSWSGATGGSPPASAYFKLAYDGTTHSCYYSTDDQVSWHSLGTITNATAFTSAADRVGIILESFNVFPNNMFEATVLDFTLS